MSGKTQPTVYVGNFVHTPTLTNLAILHDTAVGVDGNGKIAFIEKASTNIQELVSKHNWPASSYKIIDTRSFKSTTFFTPGFIDTHTHASQYPNTGIFGNSTLLDWLNTYTFPLESSYSSAERAATIYSRVVARSLSHGTTCAAYYATVHVPATNLLADICHRRGQRALIGRVCMNRMSPETYRDESAEASISLSKQVIAHCESIDPTGSIVRPIITPRFAPSCTPECLSGLGALHASTQHFIQTHISENQPEIALVKDLFPEHDDYASVYDSHGLLTSKTILAHAVHLTPAEQALILKRNSKISHCPASNTSLTSGAAPIRAYLAAGLTVGLGTDMSGGFSPSILEMARQSLLVSRHVAFSPAGDASAKLNVEEALYLATRGGAHVVGLEHKVGAFEVGLEWDAQFIDLGEDIVDAADEIEVGRGPVDLFGGQSWEDLVAKWVYTGDDRNVKFVWVAGRLVHEKK